MMQAVLSDNYVRQLLKQLSKSNLLWAKENSAFPESPVLYRQALVFNARRRCQCGLRHKWGLHCNTLLYNSRVYLE
jgi:hypothetical protein